MVTAAQGRSYEHTLCAGRSLELSGVARLLWGKGWYGRRVHALPQLAVCLRDHGLTVPESLVTDRLPSGRRAPGMAVSRKAKTGSPRSITTRAATSPWDPLPITAGTNGVTRKPCCICGSASGPKRPIWINHPGETIQFGYGRPSFWGGCGTLPRAHQYRGLAVLDFSTFDEQPDFTHAWFPVGEFDESSVNGTLALARCGNGRDAAARQHRSRCDQGWSDPPNAELRQYGRKTRWIVRVCEASTLGRWSKPGSRRLRVEEKEDGSLAIEDPDYGDSNCFVPDGSVEAEGRTVSPKDLHGCRRGHHAGCQLIAKQRGSEQTGATFTCEREKGSLHKRRKTMQKTRTLLAALAVGLLTSTAALAGDVRIMWYSDGVEGEVLKDLLNRFMKENPGINVVLDNVVLHGRAANSCQCSSKPATVRISPASPT